MASDSTLFVCSTEPLSPWLSTRTGTFVLLAPVCFAAERAAAAWSLFADWPIACVPPAPD